MRFIALSAAVALAIVVPAPAAAAITSPYTAIETRPVAPGVRHERGSAAATNGHLAVHVVEADITTPGIHLETSLALDRVNAREQPTSQAARLSREGHRVVATINGSTFGSWPSPPYGARGLNVSDGELITAGHPRHGEKLTSFGIDSAGRPLIGTPTMQLTVTLADGSVAPLHRVNQRRQPDQATLYSPRFDASTLTDDTGLEIVVGGLALPLRPGGTYGGSVVEVRHGLGNTPLAADTVVISAHGTALEPLAAVEEGDELTISLAIDAAWQDAQQAVGARELLLRNGAIDIFPLGGNTFNSSEPRTAVGITAVGRVLLVVIDGRVSHSRGVTIPELAELMLGLGAVDAVNLDGGGSTMLSVRQPGQVEAAIVNSPSSGSERTVANALHVVSSIPTGPLSEVVVLPARAELSVDETRQFTLGGHDAAYNGIVPELGPVGWGTSNERASIDDDGLLTALAAGQVTVDAQAGGWSASASVTVLGQVGPTVPQGLSGVARDNFVIELSWQPSTSSVSGPIHYRVFRSGSAIGTQQLALSYTDQRKKANTFQYQVRAIDAAGNKSDLSPPITISSVEQADGGGSGGEPPPPSGVTVPQGLTATVHDNFVVKLAWQPSTSSVNGTIRYRVFRNGMAIGTKQTATTFTDQRKKVNTFRYQVRAIDAAGNKSALSPAVTVTTVKSTGSSEDLNPPSGVTVPQGLTATAHDNFVIKLSWQPSTSSASGTIRYRVFRNGTAIGTRQTATTFTDQRKKANTFEYRVRAIDSAGNKSALSPPITISSVKTAP